MKNKLLLLLYIFTFFGSFISSAHNCPGDTAGFTSTPGACNVKTISFSNTSIGATTYFWDFGDGTTLGDTSLLQNPPPYTYPILGTFTATLIVDKGTPCADTIKHLVNMSFVVSHFSHDAPKCISTPVNFVDASTIGPGAVMSWLWSFDDPGSGVNNTSTLQNPSHLFTVGNQTLNVKLVTSSSLGCKDSITIGAAVQNRVVTNAGPNITTCKNDTIVNLVGSILNAGGGFWTGSGSFSSTTSLSPIYRPTAASKAHGSDTVLLTSSSSPFCPNVTDTLVILFNPGPIIHAGSDQTVCKDTSGVPLHASVIRAAGGIWHTLGGGSFGNANDTITIYHPSSSDTAAGSVILYIESTGNGICISARDSLKITFTPTPTVLIKTNDSVCSGSPIILTVAVSTGSGFWSTTGTGTFIPSANALTGTYIPSVADKLIGHVSLRFTSTNNTGCHPVTDTLKVFVKPAPVAAFTSTTVCKGAPTVFTDHSTPAGSITNWNWIFETTGLPSILQSPSHVYSSCGSHNTTLIVTGSNGCIDTQIQAVNVFCLPAASFLANGNCLNTGTIFTDSSTVPGASITNWNWRFGDNLISAVQNPTHYYFAPNGAYSVTLVVKSSQGCIDSVTQPLNVLSVPVVAFTANDVTADIGQNINFTNQSTSAVAWHWDFGDASADSKSTIQNPLHTYTTAGVYNVCLIVTDINGCADGKCEQETVSTTPAGPSGFTPNGDGQNDIFYFYGGPYKTVEFKIYNGWGELVFESHNQSDGWDGKRNGIPQAMGVYVYTVIGVTEDDTEYRISGDVTLLR